MRSRPATVSRLPSGTRLGRWRLVLVVLGLVFVALLLVGGEDGFYRLWSRRQELRQLEGRVAALEAENDSLRQVLWRLENDREYIEKVAREEYGMSRQGERVYRLHPREEDAQGGK